MIKRIELKNFKCFEDESVDLSALSLLTGINGMGKSTVLQALLLLRQNYELGLLKEYIFIRMAKIKKSSLDILELKFNEKKKLRIDFINSGLTAYLK